MPPKELCPGVDLIVGKKGLFFNLLPVHFCLTGHQNRLCGHKFIRNVCTFRSSTIVTLYDGVTFSRLCYGSITVSCDAFLG